MPTKTDQPSPSLYRKYFTPAERRALDALSEPGITSEINLLRVVLARNFGTVLVPADLKSRLSALRARAHAASLIASLLRTQVFTLNARGELERLIDEALKDIDPYLVHEPATDPSPSIFTSPYPLAERLPEEAPSDHRVYRGHESPMHSEHRLSPPHEGRGTNPPEDLP